MDFLEVPIWYFYLPDGWFPYSILWDGNEKLAKIRCSNFKKLLFYPWTNKINH